MTENLLRVVAYGLIAAASPVALAATLVVLKTRQPRLNGFLFASAFLLGEAIVVVLVITIGSIAVPGEGGSSTAAATFELVLGLLLLVAGVRARRRPATELAPAEEGTRGRTQAVLDRLAGITAKTALGAGVLLGIGGPKRLTVSLVTGTTIAAGGLTARQQTAEVVLYVLLGGLLVWVPVALFIVAGTRSRALLTDAERWLTTHERTIATVLLFLFGALLVVDALVNLV